MRKYFFIIISSFVTLILSIGIFLYGSLPTLDGEITTSHITHPVEVLKDDYGVPRIKAKNREDLSYSTGFIHAQDRFFQMDLQRRAAAGELSELFGTSTLQVDKKNRIHRFRTRAKKSLQYLDSEDKKILESYTKGVNDGLKSLSTWPFEYALLGLKPKPWSMEDSALVIYSMYIELQESQLHRQVARLWLKANTNDKQYRYLLPEFDSWEAPLDKFNIDENYPSIPNLPPEWFARPLETSTLIQDYKVGSNSWALAGFRTKDKSSIIANDMHLKISLPHIWYRLSIEYLDNNKKKRSIVGVSLPGTMAVVTGSNGLVAWGYTNSYGEFLKLVAFDQHKMKTQTHHEKILIKGDKDFDLPIVETNLGPIIHVENKKYVIQWEAYKAKAINLEILDMEKSENIHDALNAANRFGMPAQNIIVGDNKGHIAWSIAGLLKENVRIIDPLDGQLWNGNSRQLANSEEYGKIGDGGAAFGARAKQIRDSLSLLKDKANEDDLMKIALDDRAIYISTWRKRALMALDDEAIKNNLKRTEFKTLIEKSWDGHASVSSVGYYLTKSYLNSLYYQLFGHAHKYKDANSRWPQTIARFIDERPQSWLPKNKKSWREIELAAIDFVIKEFTSDGKKLSDANWGVRNTTAIFHPMVKALPILKPWLSAPALSISGDSQMPKVAGPSFGQSERIVVSPGREEKGLFNMPGGQSGHPLSPYFLKGHQEWLEGKAMPLRPGKAKHHLIFVPKNVE